MSRKGQVYVFDAPAGVIEETDSGDYIFRYSEAYLASPGAVGISLTLPLRPEPYVADQLFPFFDGLIPEGWLLNLYTKNWKLNPGDRMALLLAACRDCVGAVAVVPIEEDGAHTRDETTRNGAPGKSRRRAKP